MIRCATSAGVARAGWGSGDEIGVRSRLAASDGDERGPMLWKPCSMEHVELAAVDCADAVALWEEVGLTRPWNDPVADFTRSISGSSSAVLGLRDDDGALAGTAMVGHDSHRGWVYYLAVAPRAQSAGHGRSLMGACEQWLIARGIPKIQLMVRTGNERVIGFYDAIGYELQETVVLGRRLDVSSSEG